MSLNERGAVDGLASLAMTRVLETHGMAGVPMIMRAVDGVRRMVGVSDHLGAERGAPAASGPTGAPSAVAAPAPRAPAEAAIPRWASNVSFICASCNIQLETLAAMRDHTARLHHRSAYVPFYNGAGPLGTKK